MRYKISGELTDKLIIKYIKKHDHERSMTMQKLYDLYMGKVPVHKTVTKSEGSANNNLNSNLAKYITDTATGYFVGVPPVYKYNDDKAELMSQIFDQNDEATTDFEIAENMSIAGCGYDLVYIDSDKRIRIDSVDPRGAFLICTMDIDPRVLAGVRYWHDDNNHDIIYGELYEPFRTRIFKLTGGILTIANEINTPFSEANLTEYPNNRHRLGDFEQVMDNINGYNLVMSSIADDIENTANAYLVLQGFDAPDEETLEVFRRDRVLGMPEDSTAQYITKNLNDSAIENHRKALKQDIMQISGVPDLSDESFGNASGVALRYKLWGIDQLFERKRQFFDRGLFHRMKLIAEAIKLVYSTDIGDAAELVSVKFTRNMPRDISTDIEDVVKISGMVSDRTKYELLEPITQVTAADEEQRIIDQGTEYGENPLIM